MKKFLQVYVPQILLIVFSVVLGLFLSEKIKERQDKQMAQQLVSHLKTEIEQCRETMLEWMPYHQDLKNKLDSLRVDDSFIKEFEKDPSAIFKVAPRGFFNGKVTSVAWETALLNPAISEISYHQMRDFKNVYNQLDITFFDGNRSPLQKMMNLALSFDFNSLNKSKQNLQAFSSSTQELIGREIDVIIYCNKALGDTLAEPYVVMNQQLEERKKSQKN